MANTEIDFDKIKQEAAAGGEKPETAKLLNMTLSQIDQLPQEERELSWEILAQHLAEMPEITDAIDMLVSVGKRMHAAVKKMAPTLQRAAAQSQKMLKQISDSFAGFFIVDDTETGLKAWEELSPYIDAEAAEHPELDTRPGQELLLAAARRARADGKDIPPLKIERGMTQRARREHIKQAHKRREAAQREGSLGEITNLATIADKREKGEGLGFDYFTSNVCKRFRNGIEKDMLDEQGRINLVNLTNGGSDVSDILQEVDELHTSFLMVLLTLAQKNSDIRETNSGNAIIPVYLPAVLGVCGIDPRPLKWDKEEKRLTKVDTDASLADLRLKKFLSFINPLQSVAAWFGDELYAVVRFDHYSKETETAYIGIPYMFRLVEYAELHATNHAAIRNIFHADIMTENQTAVEIANRIAMGLITRGVTRADSDTYKNKEKPKKRKRTETKPDGTKIITEETFSPDPVATVSKSRTDENGDTITVTAPAKKEKFYTFDISFKSLIADCPQLQRELDEIRNGQGEAEREAREHGASAQDIAKARSKDHKNDSQRTNKKLKDAFTAAIRIIMEKSDAFQYYKDLTIRTARFDTFKPPTNSTLSDKLIIRHRGKNPNYVE